MLEDSLLAYLLYKYTLYRTFIINNYYIKSSVFIAKLIAFKSIHIYNYNCGVPIFSFGQEGGVVKIFCMI